LRIRIDTIKEEGQDLEFSEPAEQFPILKEMVETGACRFPAPIDVAVRLFRVGEMVEAAGTIHTQLGLECSRCLREFTAPLQASFEVTFSHELPPVADEESGEEVELSAEEMGLLTFHGEELDLLETVQEQVVIALPLRPLCDEACKGLCPHCGADLNAGDCGCSPQSFNSKFAALKNFKVEK
jgi:uncharacterized protein